MSHFVFKSASTKAQSMTSFVLAFFMVFQAMGPGFFAIATAYAFAQDPQVPPSKATCLIPGGDTAENKITSFGTSIDNPPLSLQNVLDNAGYSINTLTQETGYQVWNVPAGVSSVTLSAKFINGIAANSNTFGYYKNGDITTFQSVFSAPPSLPGALSGPIVINTVGATSIAFAIKSSDGSTTKIFATAIIKMILFIENIS